MLRLGERLPRSLLGVLQRRAQRGSAQRCAPSLPAAWAVKAAAASRATCAAAATAAAVPAAPEATAVVVLAVVDVAAPVAAALDDAHTHTVPPRRLGGRLAIARRFHYFRDVVHTLR